MIPGYNDVIKQIAKTNRFKSVILLSSEGIMKKFLSIILAVIILASCFAVGASAFKDSYTAKDNLVQYVPLKEKHVYSDGDSNETVYTYDSKGNLTKEVFTNPYDHSSEIKNSYDSKGNLTKCVSSYSECDSETRAYTYDSKGNLTKETYLSSEGEYSSYTYTYNSRGDITKEVKNYYSGLVSTRSCSYDSKGRKVKETYYDTDGDSYSYTYSYDSNGNKTREIFSSPTNGSTTISYSYDSNNRLTKESYKYSDRSTYTVKYSYDQKGNKTKEVHNDSDGYIETYTYSYDSKNHLTKEAYANTMGEYWTSVYTYDSKGNRTKAAFTNSSGYSDSYTETYDSKNRLIKTVYASSEGEVRTNTMTYDSHGNQTRETYTDSYGCSWTWTCTYKKLSTAICKTEDGIRLSAYKYAYDGKAKEPAVFIEGYFKGRDYKVSYSNNVNPGTAQAVITFTNNDADDDVYGHKEPVTVLFEIVPGKVTGLKQAKVTATTMKLSWNKVSGAKYYTVQYSKDGKTWKTAASAVSSTSCTVKNLKAGTKYSFRVRALDSTKKISGSYSSTLTKWTLCASPTISLKSTKSRSVTVSWSKLTGAKKYVIFTSSDGKNWKKAKTSTSTSATLTGLTGGRKLYVKVQAANADGLNGAFCSAKSITVKR